jgi:hypothetical protein
MVVQTTKQTWRGFIAGQRVRMLIDTRGASADEDEIVHPSGTLATISRLADFGEFQGEGVDLVIGEGSRAICNSFDDRDVEELGNFPFTHA